MSSSAGLRVGVILLSFFGLWSTRAFAAPSAAPSPAAASTDQDKEPEQLTPSEGQLRFAEQYIKAVNSKDLNAMRRLIAPKTLACFTPRTQPYLDSWLTRQIRDPISKPYSITVEKNDASDEPRTMLFTMPVPPTYQINITTSIDGEQVVLGRPIAYVDGRWYEAAPCPTDVGMDEYNKRQQYARERAAKLDALYAGLKDPLRSDLKKLIAQNQMSEACRKFAAANKITYQVGCQVMKRLAQDMNAGK